MKKKEGITNGNVSNDPVAVPGIAWGKNLHLTQMDAICVLHRQFVSR